MGRAVMSTNCASSSYHACIWMEIATENPLYGSCRVNGPFFTCCVFGITGTKCGTTPSTEYFACRANESEAPGQPVVVVVVGVPDGTCRVLMLQYFLVGSFLREHREVQM